MARISPKETLIGGVILMTLMVVGLFMWQQRNGSRPDPVKVVVNMPPVVNEKAAAPVPTDFSIPTGAVDVNSPESFGPDDLSEKIDGKADFYLSSGFERLFCRRFAMPETPRDWIEACSFVMKSRPAAFSVYSRQRRNPDTLEFTNINRGYTTSAGFFLVTGNRYFEVIRSNDSDPARKLAIEFIRGLPPVDATLPQLPELALLPTEGLIKGTETIHLSGAFGLAFPGPVASAQFGDAASPLTVFVYQADSTQRASELMKACTTDLSGMGATRSAFKDVPPGMLLFDAAGRFELIGSVSSAIFGVHDAENVHLAIAAAQRTQAALKTAMERQE